MNPQHPRSPFLDLASVEAWDAWFRWRDGTVLRDLSIEDTWHRIALALTSVECGAEAGRWRSQFMDALSSWRLLPDERLFAAAGTGKVAWRSGVPCAVLNVAAFVSPTRGDAGSFDLGALADCAAMAVRALDNAALLAGMTIPDLRIGVAGLADALALLGQRYDSESGREQATLMAGALARGCLHGDSMLAAARGAGSIDTKAILARAIRRKMSPELLRAAARHGSRHRNLTAITSQPRLALLANDVADALDPLHGEQHLHLIAASDGSRAIRSRGYALNLLQSREKAPEPPDTVATLPCASQIAMRAALQPWMDEPITYPLLATRDPDDGERNAARHQAAAYGLVEPVWRMCGLQAG